MPFFFFLVSWSVFPHTHCSHIVIIKSLKGPMRDLHLGLVAIMGVIKARMGSNQMATEKISVKVSCEKAKLGFPMSPRAHGRTAKAGSSAQRGKTPSPHLESDHLEVSSFLLEMLHNS